MSINRNQNNQNNPDCPACTIRRMHTRAEWDEYHPTTGTDFSRAHGVPKPEPVTVVSAVLMADEAELKLIDVQTTQYADLAAWSYKAIDYIRGLEQRLGITRSGK